MFLPITFIMSQHYPNHHLLMSQHYPENRLSMSQHYPSNRPLLLAKAFIAISSF
jgi:hypothetical protein